MDKKIFKIITLDLDGTLMDSSTKLARDNRAALEKAHQLGAHIVPNTGRLYSTLPEDILELPFLQYVVEANGSRIYDAVNKCVVADALLPIDRAMEIYNWLDSIDCIYDCYVDGQAYVERRFYEAADIYCAPCYGGPFYWRTRKPVDGFKAFIRQKGVALQKISAFFKQPEDKYPIMEKLKELFPDTSVTTSLINNIEISAGNATKGAALETLCRHLDISIEDTIAFGDELNDVSMITQAGIGVAMANACDAVKQAADHITLSNNECGVAAALRLFMLPKE